MPDHAATPYTVRPLDSSTSDAFAELVERNGGIFGGCWCMSGHPEGWQEGLDKRAAKEERVRTGRAHAALVFDADGRAQGWARYGSVEELPYTSHRRAYSEDPPPRPDWRISCFYVDKRQRGQGIARAALEGALDQIARSSCSSSTDSGAYGRSANTHGSSAASSTPRDTVRGSIEHVIHRRS